MKDSFTYRREWLERLLELPRAVRQEVCEAIAVYGITGEATDLKPKAKAAFEPIKASMDCAELQRSRQMKKLAGMRWKNGDEEATRNDDEKFYHAYRINFDAARINGKKEQSCGRISGKTEQREAPEASRARIEVRDYLTLQQEDNIECVSKGGVGERNGDTDDAAAGRHTHTLKAGAAEGMEARRRRLYESLIPYVDKYGAQLVRDFFDYWSEPDHTRKRMRYELERTWSAKNRLRAWAAREDQFHGRKGGPTPTQKAAKARGEAEAARMAKENAERATAQRHDPECVTREEYLAMKAAREKEA